jgi:hypothetical protein
MYERFDVHARKALRFRHRQNTVTHSIDVKMALLIRHIAPELKLPEVPPDDPDEERDF